MRFIFTMHMPSAKGSMIHQVFGEYDAESLDEMSQILSGQDFILVRQFYKDSMSRGGELIWIEKGDIILNTFFIGKVQAHNPEHDDAMNQNDKLIRR